MFERSTRCRCRSSAASTARRSAAAPGSPRSATSSSPPSDAVFGLHRGRSSASCRRSISPFVLREDRRLRRARAVPDRRAVRRRARAARSAWSTRSCRRPSSIAAVGRRRARDPRRGPEAVAAAKALIREVGWRRDPERRDRHHDRTAIAAQRVSSRRARRACAPFSRSGSRHGADDVPPRADRQSRRDRRAHHARLPRELGIETVAVYSDADADAPHVARGRSGRPHRPAAAARELPLDRRRSSPRRRRPAPTPSIRATAFCPRTPRSRAACADAGLDVRRPAGGERSRGWDRRSRARALMAAAGVPVVPGADARAIRSTTGIAAAVERRRLPAAGQGVGRRRRQGHARRSTTRTADATRSPRRGAKRWRRSATARSTSSG